ncbi:MAG: P-aminobenzoate N-oxygenase AurF [Acidimicrobiales bacterium]|nr:P-aminobenzoate N-oxygenase AurF [Acidimicrobiales bacterium]
MATDAEILGRNDVDDIDAILAITNRDVEEAIHVVQDNADAIFTWDYEKGKRPALNKLYEKAKHAQWNGETDLDWSIEVDQERQARNILELRAGLMADAGVDLTGTPMEKWTEKEWIEFSVENQNWSLSQFMHGEQGALICTAKIVETVPWIDAKYYASTQVMDEARHVEVFAKYLDTKLQGHYPINAHLQMLLDDIINDSRWDMTYLGMQIMVEGLALAAFGMAHQTTEDPLLKQLLRYVMSDEARHVAFGVLSLKEFYDGLTAAELLERQEFAFEAAVRMRDRFLQQEVWERMGVDVKLAIKTFNVGDKNNDPFQQLLFSKIVPNCKKLGLLDANDGWLRQRFDTLGVTQFEDWVDTGEEYLELDAVSADRAAAAAEEAAAG